MGIAQKLAREFNEAVRSRGQSYFAKNRVAITAASAGEVVARVKGTEKYKVRLRLRGIKLIAQCSCPYFNPTGAPCKHLWATLMAVDARGLLPSALVRPLRLITDQQVARPPGPAEPLPGPGRDDNGGGNGGGEAGPAPWPQPRPFPEPSSGYGPGRNGPPPRGPGPGYGPGPGPNANQGQGPPQPGRGQGPRQGPPQRGSQGPPQRGAQGPPQRGAQQGPPRRGVQGPPEHGTGAGYGPPQRGPGPGYGPSQPGPGPGQGQGQGPGQNHRPYPPGYGPQARGPNGPNGPQARGPNGPNGPNGQGRPGPGPGPGQGQGPGRPNPKDRRVRGPGGEGVNGNINPQAHLPHPQSHAHLHAQQQQAKAQARAARAAAAAQQKAKRLLAYILDVPATLGANQVVIDLARRARRPNGDWGPLKAWWHTPNLPVVRYDPEDRELLADLVEAQGHSASASAANANGHGDAAGTRRFVLKAEAQGAVVERLARSGRLRVRRAEGEDDPPLVRWDEGPPWRFGLDVRSDPTGKRWSWRGMLRRPDGRGGSDRMDLAEPLALLPGLVIQGVGKIARFDVDPALFLWVMRVRHEKEMAFPDSPAQDLMLEKLLPDCSFPAADLIDSETLNLRELTEVPQPCLTLRTPRQNWGTDRLIAELGFDYAGAYVPIIRAGNLAVRTDLNLVVHRNIALEQAAGIQLYELGFKDAKDHLLDPGSLELPAKRVPQVTKELVGAGWRVEAEGKLIRPAGEFKLAVTTGIDWFELGGQVDFGGQSVELPELLAAARRGETMVSLGDGSMGMLPEDWLKKYGMLADLGTAEDETGPIRFGKAQAGLLDALLASQPEIKLDIGFGKVRQALPRFDGVHPKDAPPGFRGELRPYQCEGLGWLEYLQKFDFGGILADDMGLGKTVQVLALLQSRRARRQSRGPSLIVVPRSLVFNWVQEAEKFCPRLKVLDYTGPNRHALRENFPDYDLIVTTFGTLRTDIVDLSQITFDYVILDEAQAIKNADSQAAKAARLLKARHRLAMSGTPIENHLGELWSIFEFLNPGMLGTASVFKKYATGASSADEGARSLLARALRPFILRRTKSQVVQDLPEKFEQTLVCDLEPAQRLIYENLKAHYRQALLRKESGEIGQNKIEVLEALLRLRQAACHPGLIDPERSGDPSAKLDMLLPQLAEVAAEGHKILVFSQFTKFLGLVRDRLDAEGLKYEYLDGRTRNRAERVERFQADPTIPLFLISLKAGGLGLNLTAAGYVYLLDPWWNPAVEAQAIDRSHRIGQTQQVFAYRLICRDTVEQKILELQQKKRDLADAILNENRNVISTLTRDDLEFLLS